MITAFNEINHGATVFEFDYFQLIPIHYYLFHLVSATELQGRNMLYPNIKMIQKIILHYKIQLASIVNILLLIILVSLKVFAISCVSQFGT